MSYHLTEIVERLGRPHILVLGDPILDRYVWGDAERVSQEAPVVLLREEMQEVRLGGAANVANMLRGLGASVCMAGVAGADDEARQLRAELENRNVDCTALVTDELRPTTLKRRYVGRAQNRHAHQMLRVDREVRTPLDESVAERLLECVLPRMHEFQAALISDYAKGVCTPHVVSQVIAAARQASIPVIVDPPATGRWDHYTGATSVTPNRLETGRATGCTVTTIDEAFAAGRRICAQLQLEHAFVTLDSDGIALVHHDGRAWHVPTRKREVYDITGAGDIVLAMIGVGAAEHVPPIDLARLANVAGGLEVEQIGVVTISREQILADLLAGNRNADHKVGDLDAVARQVDARRRQGQRIVFTNGCFDLLHVGHVTYLQQAAREGDCLVVAVNSDESVRRLNKGPDRPIFGQDDRAAMLAALEAVDYVVIFGEETPHRLLERLRPDVLVKGGTYAKEEIVGREIVESYGGEVKALIEVPGVSTTSILERCHPSPSFPPHAPHNSQSGRKAG